MKLVACACFKFTFDLWTHKLRLPLNTQTSVRCTHRQTLVVLMSLGPVTSVVVCWGSPGRAIHEVVPHPYPTPETVGGSEEGGLPECSEVCKTLTQCTQGIRADLQGRGRGKGEVEEEEEEKPPSPVIFPMGRTTQPYRNSQRTTGFRHRTADRNRKLSDWYQQVSAFR